MVQPLKSYMDSAGERDAQVAEKRAQAAAHHAGDVDEDLIAGRPHPAIGRYFGEEGAPLSNFDPEDTALYRSLDVTDEDIPETGPEESGS